MEKRKPHHDLNAFRKQCGNVATLRMTVTAQRDALELGYGTAEVAGVVSGMTSQQFYKSMTTYANHRIWQDVYHVPHGDCVLYVKFSGNAVCEFTLVSFKEKK